MKEVLFQFYGIDLVATVATLVGIYQLGNKKKAGFVVATVGNLLWIGFGVMSHSIGILIVNIAIAVLNLRGYLLWKEG